MMLGVGSPERVRNGDKARQALRGATAAERRVKFRSETRFLCLCGGFHALYMPFIGMYPSSGLNSV